MQSGTASQPASQRASQRSRHPTHRPVGADDAAAIQGVECNRVAPPTQIVICRLLLAAGKLHGAAGAQRIKHAAAAAGIWKAG